jgi:hypothetical protein
MKLPADVARLILEDSPLGFDCTRDGRVVEGFEKGWSGIPYPPERG